MHSQTYTTMLAIAANYMTPDAYAAYEKDAKVAFLNSRIDVHTNELNDLLKMRVIPSTFVAQRTERIAYLQDKLSQLRDKLAEVTA